MLGLSIDMQNVCLLPHAQHSNDLYSKENERSLELGNIGFPHVHMRVVIGAEVKLCACDLVDIGLASSFHVTSVRTSSFLPWAIASCVKQKGPLRLKQ